MQKKVIALLIIFSFIIMSFQGCSKKEQTSVQNSNLKTEQQKTKNPSMGRFMEKKVDFPKMGDNEKAIKIIQNTKGKIELYSTLQNKSEVKYHCYTLKDDMTWESSQPAWLNGEELKSSNTTIVDLCCGEDGNYYACYANFGTDQKYHIIKSEDNGKTAKTVKLPYLDKVVKTVQTTKLYPSIQNMDVLKNGNIILYDMLSRNSLLIFSPEGDKLDELPVVGHDDAAYFKAFGNDITTAGENNKAIVFYNTENKKTERTIKCDLNENAMAFAMKKDGTVLMGNTNGIHRLTDKATLWETTVDGSLNSMSMPSLSFDGLFVKEGKLEEYYASYQDNDGNYELMHYVYDKNVTAVPENEITVYSLKENNTIRQAVSMFQSENSNIKVNYVVAMGEEGGGTASDCIRALNTELLAGHGADILVLDGLPVDSYLEKGVLADISDIITPLEKNGFDFNEPVK